ncbi:MAG: DUF2238 domain-containing protein [Phycisphaerae bacterium]|jgi:hypothetical protein
MYARKGQLPILIINLIALVLFSVHFLANANYEFVLYVGVITFFLIVLVLTNSKVYYPNGLLWALTVWALLHLSGGALYLNGERLYDIILIPLSDKLPIFRYDQLVHIFGFGAATALMFYVLKPLLRPGIERFTALTIVITAAGLGIGALNEIVEFITSVIVPESGVGGYLNTSLDLVADLIGAILAVGVIRVTDRKFFSKKYQPAAEKTGS